MNPTIFCLVLGIAVDIVDCNALFFPALEVGWASRFSGVQKSSKELGVLQLWKVYAKEREPPFVAIET